MSRVCGERSVMKRKTTVYFVAEDESGGVIRLSTDGPISNRMLAVLREAGYHIATKKEYRNRQKDMRSEASS